MSKNVWLTIGFIVVAIAAFYAGKTGFWGLATKTVTPRIVAPVITTQSPAPQNNIGGLMVG